MKFVWTTLKCIVNSIRASYEVHMKFLRISYEMKSTLFIWNSREVHMNFVWCSNELLMNFIWNEIKFIHMNLHAVRMKFIWPSYLRTNEVNIVYPCYTKEVDMSHINSSHEIHMKFIWISNDLNFMWTSCELHKNYITTAQEVPFYYTWIWFLASLLCTSYEWASRSIVQMCTVCTSLFNKWVVLHTRLHDWKFDWRRLRIFFIQTIRFHPLSCSF